MITSFLIATIIVLGSFVFASVLSGCSVVPPVFWPLLGYKKVRLYDGEYDFNEPFVTYVREIPGAELQTAFRYNFTKTGRVRLYPNGRAEYCGSYKWMYV